MLFLGKNYVCLKWDWRIKQRISRIVCHPERVSRKTIHAIQITLTAKIMIEFTEGIYNFYVYIITNKAKTVLYTGMTNNLRRRLQEHNEKLNPNCFTAKYNVEFLLYYEHYSSVQQAIAREKEIKLMKRDNKLELIQSSNPNLDFLNDKF
jgi:putative endonuclease